MKSLRWLFLICLAVLVGCSQSPPLLTTSAPPGLPANTNPLPPGDVPDVQVAARSYLDAWVGEDYPAMYALLTSVSQHALSQEEFTQHYQSILAEAALSGVSYEILSSLVNPQSAQVGYRVTLTSILVGDITRNTVMNLSLEKGTWRVQWDDTLILPELQGGNYLYMDRQGYTPARANIMDRDGRAMVAQTDAFALGIYPDDVDPDQLESLAEQLSEVTDFSVEALLAMIESAPKNAGWYIPLGEIPGDLIASKVEALAAFDGLVLQPYNSRFYFNGGIAPHVLGYVSAIQPDEIEEYKRKGYRQDEKVGRSGLEQWGEPYLSGRHGGALYVFNAQGSPATRLAAADAQPAQPIYTTLSREFQLAAQQALGGFRGAVVVLERDTGRVLAMVSSPGFDPNAFEPLNFNSASQLFQISSDPEQPLFNRATQGQYPLGSVFKIITMAAGLESGFYTPETTYQCGYLFEEIPGVQLHDWTYDYYLRDGRTIPSGLLTLSEGLMRSCNPYFFHIGLDLYNRGLDKAVSDMARGFGLGSATGLVGVEEAPGLITNPVSPIDATNMAIGQGEVLVTPLQVAAFVAAIGNGGTLYQPQVVERILLPDGKPQFIFTPQTVGKLPVTQETLQAIQTAMVGVIRNERPRGTAWHRFTGLDLQVAGKTGTAQTGSDRPHAWFAGYTFAGQVDKPDIAVAVIVENAGEGSDYAAPIFRRIVELYFSGQPQKLYWWESAYNVTPTPTPGLETPAPLTTPGP